MAKEGGRGKGGRKMKGGGGFKARRERILCQRR